MPNLETSDLIIQTQSFQSNPSQIFSFHNCLANGME